MLITQLAQQLSGVTAVMYFSTSILSPLLPADAKLIALGIVILKVPITTTPAFLIERCGTRPLLLYPTMAMTVCMLALGLGLNLPNSVLAVTGMVAFVASFSVGLGPVTWVVMGEVMPVHARDAASSLGLALNWSTNFIVGATFLPLQQRLAGKEGGGEGNIFFVFAGMCGAAVLGIFWGYRRYGGNL